MAHTMKFFKIYNFPDFDHILKIGFRSGFDGPSAEFMLRTSPEAKQFDTARSNFQVKALTQEQANNMLNVLRASIEELKTMSGRAWPPTGNVNGVTIAPTNGISEAENRLSADNPFTIRSFLKSAVPPPAPATRESIRPGAPSEVPKASSTSEGLRRDRKENGDAEGHVATPTESADGASASGNTVNDDDCGDNSIADAKDMRDQPGDINASSTTSTISTTHGPFICTNTHHNIDLEPNDWSPLPNWSNPPNSAIAAGPGLNIENFKRNIPWNPREIAALAVGKFLYGTKGYSEEILVLIGPYTDNGGFWRNGNALDSTWSRSCNRTGEDTKDPECMLWSLYKTDAAGVRDVIRDLIPYLFEKFAHRENRLATSPRAPIASTSPSRTLSPYDPRRNRRSERTDQAKTESRTEFQNNAEPPAQGNPATPAILSTLSEKDAASQSNQEQADNKESSPKTTKKRSHDDSEEHSRGKRDSTLVSSSSALEPSSDGHRGSQTPRKRIRAAPAPGDQEAPPQSNLAEICRGACDIP